MSEDLPPKRVPTEEQKATARGWFERAREVADSRNYDYAITCVLNGLEVWPDAVEEGHNLLRLIAVQRMNAGGKKPGMMEVMKLKGAMAGRDPVRAMLAAEALWAKDLGNLGYVEAMIRNAARAGCDDTVMWIGPLFFEAVKAEGKAHAGKLVTLKDAYLAVARRAEEAEDAEVAVEAMSRAVEALSHLSRLKPSDMAVAAELRNLAGQLTILKGKYGTAESFKESVREAEVQKDIHDRERLVQSEQRLDELIAKARREYEAEPDQIGKLFALVELMCRRDDEAEENEAIRLLTEAYERTGNYRLKQRADDIRMRQMTRKGRALRDAGDSRAYAEHQRRQLEMEIEIYRERVREYPTDARLKYQLGSRLFRRGDYDEAIPLFQEARNDPRHRDAADVAIGRCFFEKGWYPQAAGVLHKAYKHRELLTDDLTKETLYWLGRAEEAAGNRDQAIEYFGRLIELDFNYRDVRTRMDALQKAG